MSTRILSQRELAEIKQRDEARTPGEWCYEPGSETVAPACHVGGELKALTTSYGPDGRRQEELDAQWIARCSTDIPRLLETAKVLWELLGEVSSRYADHSPGCPGLFRIYAEPRPCECGYREWAEKVAACCGGPDECIKWG